MKRTGIPAWVTSQRQARGLCDHCGQRRGGLVTWADGRRHPKRTERLCNPCFDKAAR